MDSFVEQLVPLRKSALETAIQIGAWVAAVLLILTCGLAFISNLLGPLSVLFAVLALLIGYGTWWLSCRINLEYEYIFTNGDLDVDKIIARRDRKRVLSVQCRDFERFGAYRPEEHQNADYEKRIIACTPDENTYYAVIRPDGKGATLLVFQPDERVLGGIKKYIPRLVWTNAFGRN